MKKKKKSLIMRKSYLEATVLRLFCSKLKTDFNQQSKKLLSLNSIEHVKLIRKAHLLSILL